MPGYTAPHEALTEDDGLTLISAGNHYLINSTFSHSPIHARAGAPIVVVHPKDAAERGLVDGGAARVGNARGSFEAAVRISDTVRAGVAATTKAVSAASTDGRRGPVATESVNATTADRDSDLGHGATFHDNRVWITPV